VALPAGDDGTISARRATARREQVLRARDSMRGRVSSRGDTPASNGNVANIVTVVRILLVPVFIWLLFLDDQQDGLWRYVAAALFILAIATDGVDGKLARGRNLVTNVGIILDPIADKLLIGGALVSLSILSGQWLLWVVTIVILIREIGITVFRFVVIRKRVIPASKAGKLKTVFQAVAISLFLTPLQALFPSIAQGIDWFDWIVMGIAFVLTVYSGVEYLVQWNRVRKVPVA
jgi:CDP-diacylglycerol---glycerol-3-phosphate 3-phosphatidyltransferase